jgi:hypothetical protein
MVFFNLCNINRTHDWCRLWHTRYHLIRSSSQSGSGNPTRFVKAIIWTVRVGTIGSIQHCLRGGGEVSHRFNRKTNNCAIKSKDKLIGPIITKRLYITSNSIASTSSMPLIKWRSFSVKRRHEQTPAIIQRAVL